MFGLWTIALVVAQAGPLEPRALTSTTTATSAPASAESKKSTPTIVWHAGGATCPSEPEFVAMLDAAVGGFDAIDNDPPWLIWVGIAQDGPGQWRAAVRTNRAEKTKDRLSAAARDVTATTCPKVSEAAALVVALALQEAGAVSPVNAIAENPPGPPDPPPPTEARSAVEPTDGPSDRPAAGWVSVRADASRGAMPALAAGVSADVSWRYTRWAWGAGLRALPVGAVRVGGVIRSRHALFALGPFGCHQYRGDAFEFGACASGEIGVLQGWGVGIDDARNRGSTWLAAGVSGFVAYEITEDYRVVADVGGSIVPFRPRFDVDPVGTTHRPDLFELRMRIGISTKIFSIETNPTQH